jgi:hypothetical protein
LVSQEQKLPTSQLSSPLLTFPVRLT